MKNIFCKGADRAILFQGLPEMNLENVVIENVVIEARTGIFCSDANAIHIKNVQVYTKVFPVMDIRNAKNIIIDNFRCSDNKNSLINISGDKTETILLQNSTISKAAIKISQDVKKEAFKIQ